MEEPDRPQSPFAGMADFSARTPLRVLLSDEIERMLAESGVLFDELVDLAANI